LENAVIVLDILLFCNLVLFAVCAFMSPRAKGARIDDLVAQATKGRPRTMPGIELVSTPPRRDNLVPFPGAAEMARRRAKPLHPSAGLRHHPGIG
jgi:hypothetical protein